MRVAAHGLPLVCVNPAVCLGAGDHLLSSTRLVRSFLLGRIPVYTDGAIGIVDVRDAAAGHLLADLRGAVGERYLLTGRNFTFERLFADLGRLSGVPTPVRIPPRAAEAAAAVLGAGRRAWPITPSEVRAAGQQLDLSLDQGAARARLARAPARGDARGHGRRGTWSASTTASPARAALSRSSTAWPALALGAAEGAAGVFRRAIVR